MKKVISILLAVLMLFSTATVAFAADETAAPETETTAPVDGEVNDGGEGEAEGEEDKTPSADELMGMLENMSWTEIKFALKFAKLVVKFALIFDKLGFIDLSPIRDAILDFAWNLIKDYVDQNQAPAEGETTAPVETTAAA